MPTVEESICCKEIPKVIEKIAEDPLNCITLHEYFNPVCLNIGVLQTAYYQYRQEYRQHQNKTPEEKLRYTAYRQFVRWIWIFLGRNIRVPIPSCAVNKIRNFFFSGL